MNAKIKTFTGIVFWTQLEGKINLITYLLLNILSFSKRCATYISVGINYLTISMYTMYSKTKCTSFE